MQGLTPVRTVRLLSSLVALVGMVFLLIERLLSAVLTLAKDGVSLGLTRYDSFTGRMALQNFAEDRQLFKMLKDVQTVFPTAEVALTVFLVVAILLLVIALVGFALPKQFVHVLVALKILKWKTDDAVEEPDAVPLKETLAKIGNIPLKKLAIPVAVIIAVVVGIAAIRGCHESVKMASMDSAVEDLLQHSLAYIEAQKAYFAKNKALGNAKALQLADTSATDYFEYKISSTRFTAVSRVPLEKCPAGTKWSVHSDTKGVFTKELALYRLPPKDSACIKLTPNFKSIGRK